MEGNQPSKRLKNQQTFSRTDQTQRAQQMAARLNIKTVQALLLKRERTEKGQSGHLKFEQDHKQQQYSFSFL